MAAVVDAMKWHSMCHFIPTKYTYIPLFHKWGDWDSEKQINHVQSNIAYKFRARCKPMSMQCQNLCFLHYANYSWTHTEMRIWICAYMKDTHPDYVWQIICVSHTMMKHRFSVLIELKWQFLNPRSVM